MKRILLALSISPLLFSITGCKRNKNSSSEPEIDFAPIDAELKGCYEYFMYCTNYKDDSNGYGLSRDRMSNSTLSSIAATGFLLASYPVFVEQQYMSKEEASTKVDKTFDTILRMQADEETSYGGCISHFVNMNNAKRSGTSEISTIDTAILVSGAITASQYFGGDLIEKANTIWGNVDFTKFVTTKSGKSHISMGVDDPTKAVPVQLSPWDYYAEQLMIYILGAGNPNENHRISSLYYKNITKKTGTYEGVSHVHSWFGSLFTYQFSQAFFNFKEYNDYKGVNYFDNSIKASKTNYLFCQNLSKNYASFSKESWGLTACDTPLGYSGELGAPPRGFGGNSTEYLRIQGTVAPTAAISSMPYTPEESYRALKYFQSLEKLNSETYGLRDAFNLDFNGNKWFDPDYIGIDKGIEVLQLYNYKVTDFVSNLAMKNNYVVQGFANNEFVKA